MQAYCVKCRSKEEMKDAKTITMKNGKPAIQGNCPICGTKMFRIGGADNFAPISITKKLLDIWKKNSDSGRADEDSYQRAFALLSLAFIPETKPIYDQLCDSIEINELFAIIRAKTKQGLPVPVIFTQESVDEKLMEFWMEHCENRSKADLCQEVCERIFGILSLGVLPETKPLLDQLWNIIDIDNLYWMAASLGIIGLWSKGNYFDMVY